MGDVHAGLDLGPAPRCGSSSNSEAPQNANRWRARRGMDEGESGRPRTDH